MTGAIRIIIAVMATALLLFLYTGSRGLDPQRAELEDTGTIEPLPAPAAPEEKEQDEQSESQPEGPDPDNSIVLPDEQESEAEDQENPET